MYEGHPAAIIQHVLKPSLITRFQVECKSVEVVILVMEVT
jgi:hypothetical protein